MIKKILEQFKQTPITSDSRAEVVTFWIYVEEELTGFAEEFDVR